MNMSVIKKIIILCIICVLTCCCTSAFNNNSKYLKNKKEINLSEKRSSVVLIKTFMIVSIKEKTATSSTTENISASGSGFIYKNNKDVSFIMTAAHVCDLINKKQILFLFPYYNEENYEIKTKAYFIAFDIDGHKYPTFQIHLDVDNDTCVLVSDLIDHEPFKMATEAPKTADRAYSINFPRGIWTNDYAPIFEGFYSGDVITSTLTNILSSNYTIPSINGSSGGVVLNTDGDIIGLIHSYYPEFNFISLSATFQSLVDNQKRAELEYIRHKEIYDAKLSIIRPFKEKINR